MPALSTRPQTGEFAPYYERYIERVPDGDVVDHLRRQRPETRAVLVGLDEARALHRYAPGKWSVKEVFGHVMDGERVFAYRALRFARGDETPLPSFDENLWTPAGGFDRRPLAALADEYDAVRAATVALFSSFDAAAWTRRGTAAENPMSVRALAYVILGHEMHHLAVLRERYGVGS